MSHRHQRGWLKKEKRAQAKPGFSPQRRQADASVHTNAVSRDRMVAAGKMLTAILSHAPDKNGLTTD